MLLRRRRTKGVKVAADEAERRVDVTIDGKPFTSYIWPTTLKKPVLYPLIAADGVTVTRGYPLEPRPGERVDHPHHAGLWFNYGNVNGFDFWNNSDAIKPEDRDEDGDDLSGEDRLHEERARSRRAGGRVGLGDGEGPGDPATRRRATSSRGKAMSGSIDQVTTLQALDKVVFNDDKEGVLGIRVAHLAGVADGEGRHLHRCQRTADEGRGGDTRGRDRCVSDQRGQ